MSSNMPATRPAAGVMVVARFQDGTVVKGKTQDFAPNKESFHIFPMGNAAVEPIQVAVADLKAVFYVKSYEGNPAHEEDYDFDRVRGHGRKATIVFHDGEVIAGYTMGYHADKPGFFLVPAEDDSNNARIYVVNAAVKQLDWQ